MGIQIFSELFTAPVDFSLNPGPLPQPHTVLEQPPGRAAYRLSFSPARRLKRVHDERAAD